MSNTFFLIVCIFILTGCGCYSQDNTDAPVFIHPDDMGKAGSSIAATDICEPVGSVILYNPHCVEANESDPAFAVVEGSIMPVDPEGWPINFRILLPETWSKRAMQQGGGGMNGTIPVSEGNHPVLTAMLHKGYAIYGSEPEYNYFVGSSFWDRQLH